MGKIGESLEKSADVLEKFKSYYKSLQELEDVIRKGVNPKKVQDLLQSKEAQEEILARMIQDRADIISKRGFSDPDALVRSYEDEARSLKGNLNTKNVELNNAERELKDLESKFQKKDFTQADVDRFDSLEKDILPSLRGEVGAAEKAVSDLPKVTEMARNAAKILIEENPKAVEEIIYELRSKAKYVSIPKQFKERLKDDIAKKANNIDDIPVVGKEFIDDNLDDAIMVSLSETASGIGGKASDLIDQNLTTLFGKGGTRGTRQVAANVVRRLKMPIRFVTKNILGSEGLFGFLYVRTMSGIIRKWTNMLINAGWDAKGIAKLALKEIPFNLVYSYVMSLPLIIFGKLGLLNTFYIRYYRHVCGDFDDFEKNVATPIMSNLFKKYVAAPANIAKWGVDKFKEKVSGVKKEIEKDTNSISTFETISRMARCKKAVEAKNLIKATNDRELLQMYEQYQNLMKLFSLSGMELISDKYYKSVSDALEKAGNMTDGNEKSGTRLIDQGLRVGKGALEKATKEIPLPAEATKIVKDMADRADTIINSDKSTPTQREAAKRFKGRLPASGRELSLEESTSLSDYRKNLLNERLEKLTIGLTK